MEGKDDSITDKIEHPKLPMESFSYAPSHDDNYVQHEVHTQLGDADIPYSRQSVIEDPLPAGERYYQNLRQSSWVDDLNRLPSRDYAVQRCNTSLDAFEPSMTLINDTTTTESCSPRINNSLPSSRCSSSTRDSDLDTRWYTPPMRRENSEEIAHKPVSQACDGLVSRLRLFHPLPDCFLTSPLEQTIDYDIPFHCPLCAHTSLPTASIQRPPEVFAKGQTSTTTFATPQLSSGSSIASSISEMQIGRPVNIVSCYDVPKLTLIPPSSRTIKGAVQRQDQVSAAIAKQPQGPAHVQTFRNFSRKPPPITVQYSSPDKSVTESEPLMPSLTRTKSAPQPMREFDFSRPPLPGRPTSAKHRASTPAITDVKSRRSARGITTRPVQHRRSLSRRANDAAGDLAVRANSIKRTIRNEVVGMITGHHTEIQRPIVRVPGERWPYIDSQYGSMESVNGYANDLGQ